MTETAIFDLDNTLLNGDSDYLWGEFIIEAGLASAERRRMNQQFMEDYESGCLDVEQFLNFQLEPLSWQPGPHLRELRSQFIESVIVPIVLPQAVALVDEHRKLGHQLLIATATNDFVTRPIATLFGIEDLVATEAQMSGEDYTGKVVGKACLGIGKKQKVETWLAQRSIEPTHCYFYSDSRNDIPLLEIVGQPFAVDPDSHLRSRAEASEWPIISLRGA